MRPEQAVMYGVGVPVLGLTIANTITAPEQMSRAITSFTLNGHDLTREAVAVSAAGNAIIFATLMALGLYAISQAANTIAGSR